MCLVPLSDGPELLANTCKEDRHFWRLTQGTGEQINIHVDEEVYVIGETSCTKTS